MRILRRHSLWTAPLHTKSFSFPESTLYQELGGTFFPDTINNLLGNFQGCMQNHLQTMNLQSTTMYLSKNTLQYVLPTSFSHQIYLFFQDNRGGVLSTDVSGWTFNFRPIGGNFSQRRRTYSSQCPLFRGKLFSKIYLRHIFLKLFI